MDVIVISVKKIIYTFNLSLMVEKKEEFLSPKTYLASLYFTEINNKKYFK